MNVFMDFLVNKGSLEDAFFVIQFTLLEIGNAIIPVLSKEQQSNTGNTGIIYHIF